MVTVKTYFGITNKLVLQAWAITRKGEKALLASKGNSRNSTIPKIVPFGMLATKGTSVDYIRTRRTYILKVLNNWKTLEEIQSSLKINNINESKKVILDDIDNFSNIGLNISFINGKFKLSDKIIGLDIPVNHSFEKDDIELLKDNVREKLQYIDHKYLVLIDLAYSNASTKTNKNTDARDFEFQTANLLTKELNFNGERLGDTSKPDVIIYSGINGAIIDTKSYKDGFSVDQHCADEMSRYILENKNRIPNNPTNEWWKRFEVNVSNFYFLFVTSFLKGNYKNNLEKISNLTYTKGAAIGVENLLYLADIIKGNGMRTDDLFTMFNNDEIVIV